MQATNTNLNRTSSYSTDLWHIDKTSWTISDLHLKLNNIIWIYMFQTHQLLNKILLSFYKVALAKEYLWENGDIKCLKALLICSSSLKPGNSKFLPDIIILLLTWLWHQSFTIYGFRNYFMCRYHIRVHQTTNKNSTLPQSSIFFWEKNNF